VTRLTTKDAASYLGKSASWLNQTRSRGDGPPYYKLGANVFYTVTDIDEWVASKKRSCVWEFSNDNRPASRAAA
jgi:predicted DNA-binding transcriptional regulator AlpA